MYHFGYYVFSILDDNTKYYTYIIKWIGYVSFGKNFGLNFNINFRKRLFFLIPYNDQLGYVPFVSGVRGYIITYIIMYISR